MPPADLARSARHDRVQLLATYDAMMERYVPNREGRFAVILDVIDALCPDGFVALDAACGPGSLSNRLLSRFPLARCVAVDADPILLDIARSSEGWSQGRLRLVRADLTAVGPIPELARGVFDVVVTTSSTHYLDETKLRYVYRRFRHVLRGGGMLLNGDELAIDPDLADLTTAAMWAEEHRRREADRAGVDDWTSWWARLGRDPALDGNTKLPRAVHEAALRTAGFHDATTVWQHLDSQVLLATAAPEAAA